MSATIPVLVDDIKRIESFPMTRCTYFTVETDRLSSDWMLAKGRRKIPCQLFGLTGVLVKPYRTELFSSRRSIDDLFDGIEKDRSLTIGSGRIFLPNDLFPSSPARGDVIRISSRLFTLAVRFQRSEFSAGDFLSAAASMKNDLKPSGIESKAFAEWERHHIDVVKKSYKRYKVDALPYIAEKGGSRI